MIEDYILFVFVIVVNHVGFIISIDLPGKSKNNF
jgi:hypothetical protein